jgi:hypothetical protein
MSLSCQHVAIQLLGLGCPCLLAFQQKERQCILAQKLAGGQFPCCVFSLRVEFPSGFGSCPWPAWSACRALENSAVLESGRPDVTASSLGEVYLVSLGLFVCLVSLR